MIRKVARLALVLFALGSGSLPGTAQAQALQDFDDGFGLWKASPQRVGRSKNPGWKVVSNAGEKAARNSPTGSKVTYYWKMSQVFDLTDLDEPTLELKHDFRGHKYSYFRVQVGDADARRLADFTTLHEETASTGVQTLELDLSEYAGTEVKIRLLLRKPGGVVEKKIGLYVHRLELTARTTVTIEDCLAYDRGLYLHWTDEDRDCQNTRNESLVGAATGEVDFLDAEECRVGDGLWEDPYTGLSFDNPIYMDIDHMVPLKEAHESGAWAWTKEERRAFSNQLSPVGQLFPVQASANRQKGAKDPGEWLPSNQDWWEDYARAWIDVKNDWGLTADSVELAALEEILGEDLTVEYPLEAYEVTCNQ